MIGLCGEPVCGAFLCFCVSEVTFVPAGPDNLDVISTCSCWIQTFLLHDDRLLSPAPAVQLQNPGSCMPLLQITTSTCNNSFVINEIIFLNAPCSASTYGSVCYYIVMNYLGKHCGFMNLMNETITSELRSCHNIFLWILFFCFVFFITSDQLWSKRRTRVNTLNSPARSDNMLSTSRVGA